MCNEFGIRGINLKPNYVCGVTFQKTYLGISLRTNGMDHVITIFWFPQRRGGGSCFNFFQVTVDQTHISRGHGKNDIASQKVDKN